MRQCATLPGMGMGADFGERMRVARTELDLTPAEAARLGSISKSSWANYERGAQTVTDGTSVPITRRRRIVLGIAKALGWSRVDALTWAGLEGEILESDREADEGETARPPELARLVDYWERMPQRRRALLLATAEEFAADGQAPERSGVHTDTIGGHQRDTRECP